jgi:hypothetical protein
METISVIVGETDWQFRDKTEDRNCEVVKVSTNDVFEGYIISLSSNGRYIVELGERVK